MSPDQKGDKNRQVFRLMEDGWGILSYICRDWSLTRFLLHSHGYHISDCNSSLPVLLNSGLTTFQYVTPRFTILQGILIFPPPILFPKTQARFLSELISSLKKKKKSGYSYFLNLIYIPFAWKILLTVFCPILFIFQVSFPDMSSFSLVLLNHFLHECLLHLDSP